MARKQAIHLLVKVRSLEEEQERIKLGLLRQQLLTEQEKKEQYEKRLQEMMYSTEKENQAISVIQNPWNSIAMWYEKIKQTEVSIEQRSQDFEQQKKIWIESKKQLKAALTLEMKIKERENNKMQLAERKVLDEFAHRRK